ncbi:hypothetical protein LINPERPRIM_LOCUS467, partial [Linum perenne]
TLLIGWWLGNEGWFTLNTDRSLISSTNWQLLAVSFVTTNDVLFWISRPNWVLYSIVIAEIRGVLDGMSLAWDKGIRKLRIQTDSSTAVHFLTDNKKTNHQHSNLVSLY